MILSGCFAVLLSLVCVSVLNSAEPLTIGTRLEPLIDDYLISHMSDLYSIQFATSIKQ